jgi:hydroxymethylbilane synthase
MTTIIVGTRGSLLATTQTGWVVDRIRAAVPGVEVETRIISTRGDADQERPLHEIPGVGAFTRELERALTDGDVDVAIHSLKDLPTTQPEELVVTAVPERESPWDLLVTRTGSSFVDLPQGARIATGSIRRGAHLRAARPDLEIVPIRGNVDTRLAKLMDPENELDGLILAEAGVKRDPRR